MIHLYSFIQRLSKFHILLSLILECGEKKSILNLKKKIPQTDNTANLVNYIFLGHENIIAYFNKDVLLRLRS